MYKGWYTNILIYVYRIHIYHVYMYVIVYMYIHSYKEIIFHISHVTMYIFEQRHVYMQLQPFSHAWRMGEKHGGKFARWLGLHDERMNQILGVNSLGKHRLEALSESFFGCVSLFIYQDETRWNINMGDFLPRLWLKRCRHQLFL